MNHMVNETLRWYFWFYVVVLIKQGQLYCLGKWFRVTNFLL